MSIHQQIREQITHLKGGKILFPTDFRGLGSDSAIKMSLSRIASEGDLKRLSHGIYMKPKPSSKKGDFIPTHEEIAIAIANREEIRIKPAGLYALYVLGFNTDMPAALTYVTDGEPRKILIGERAIVFKATTPKKLSMKGPISSLIIQALEEIGKVNLTSDTQQKIKVALSKEAPQNLIDDIKKAPAWIYNLLIKIKTDTN